MPANATGANPFADTEDQAALRQLARDVAARELAPMARHGDETEEFPQWAWDGMRKAELFGITIGERWGGAGLGDVEAAIVLEELARADVSSAILAQLIFNGPPRAIEHLGNDALKDRWLPIAAGDERSRARVRRRAGRARRRAALGRPREPRVVQDADLTHQPRTLRQRGDVRRRRAGRARVRGQLHERAQGRRPDPGRSPGPPVE